MLSKKFNFSGDSGGDPSQVRHDVFVNTLAGFIILTILLLIYLNPPAKKDDEEENVIPPGNVSVEIVWPSEIDADIDLWCQAPGDVPVGFSNRSGVVFDLLRDDLGRRWDLINSNYENSYSRGIVSGEYTVNVHWYNNFSGAQTVPVTVVVSVDAFSGEKGSGSNANASAAEKKIPRVQILKTEVELQFVGEEITAARFKLTEEGKLVPGSVHALFKPLITRR